MTDLTAKHPARLMFTDDEGNDYDLSRFALRDAVVEAARALIINHEEHERYPWLDELCLAVEALEQAEKGE